MLPLTPVSPYRAVMFDMDGTLIDSAAATDRAWRSWLAAHDLDPELAARRETGRRPIDNLRVLAPAVDARAEAERLERMQAEDTAGVTAYPGAAELLAGLTLPWAVTSSSNRRLIDARFRAAGLPLPKTVLSGDEVRRGKPDPDAYLRTAEALAVAPGDAVVVEDAPAGVAAGRAAGAFVIAVSHTHACADLAGADACVASLAAVGELLDGER